MPIVLVLFLPVIISVTPFLVLGWLIVKHKMIWRFIRPRLRKLLLQVEVQIKDPARRMQYYLMLPVSSLLFLVSVSLGSASADLMVSSLLEVAPVHVDRRAIESVAIFPWTVQLACGLVALQFAGGLALARYAGRIARIL